MGGVFLQRHEAGNVGCFFINIHDFLAGTHVGVHGHAGIFPAFGFSGTQLVVRKQFQNKRKVFRWHDEFKRIGAGPLVVSVEDLFELIYFFGHHENSLVLAKLPLYLVGEIVKCIDCEHVQTKARQL